MRIDEITRKPNARRKQPKPDLWFHGTSSTLLPEIRQQGLIPNPPQRVYGQDHYLQSYPGVYLAGSDEQAMNAAEVACQRFGGSPVLVGILAHASQATIDEDRIMEHLMGFITDEIEGLFNQKPVKIVHAYLTNANFRSEIAEKFYQDFSSVYGDVDQTLFTKVIDAYMQTLARYPNRHSDVGLGTITATVPGFRDNMLALMNLISGEVAVGHGDESTTIRYPKKIWFRGVPRISWIIEYPVNADSIVRMGKPPKRFLG